MAQNEEMKRLLRKGNIVGYEWHKVYHGIMYIRHGNKDFTHSEELHPLVPEEPAIGIDHDSFELGINGGDEWWFVGDIGEHPERGKFTIEHNGMQFYCNPFRDEINNFFFVHCVTKTIRESKKIGNIHDNPEMILKG